MPWVKAPDTMESTPPPGTPLARKLNGFAPVSKMTPPGSWVGTPVHPVTTPLFVPLPDINSLVSPQRTVSAVL